MRDDLTSALGPGRARPVSACPTRPKTRLRRTAWLLAAALALAAAAAPAGAHGRSDHERAREAVRSGEAMPLDALLVRVGAAYPGRVLELELEREHGRWVYEIRVLQADGRLLRLDVDAATAEVLRVRDRGRRGGERRR